MNLSEHVGRMQESVNRRREIYKACNARFSVNPFIFLWRSRYRAIYLFAMMGIWLQEHPRALGYGATIKKWRNAHTTVGAVVTRSIIAAGTQRKYFTRAEIEVAVGSAAKSTAVKAVIRTGVEYGLLYKSDNDRYALTTLCKEESFDRVLFKMLTPVIIEFCEYVVMWNQMQKTAEHVGDLEKSGELGEGHYRSVNEELVRGTYDDDVFGDAGRPATDTSRPATDGGC
jgi:hypothetical protein